MKRLILHIGTHKTGTTALQGFLLDNMDNLQKKGVCYPPTAARYRAVEPSRNGRFLYEYARMIAEPEFGNAKSLKATAKNIADFKQVVMAHDTVLLSDEGLWFIGEKHEAAWGLIKELLEECGVECVDIVVYIRRQDQFLMSLWNQFVKGRTKLRISLDGYARGEVVRRVMDYDAGLRRLSATFGKEHVHVRVYERAQLVDSDICRDFCEVVGIDSASMSFQEHRTNPSLTNNALEIKRQVNYVSNYRELDENFLSKPAQEISALASEKGASYPMSAEVRAELLETYREGNARVAREYLGREDGVLFTPPSPDSGGGKRSKPPHFNPLMRDTVRFFAYAITDEHERLNEAEERIAELESELKAVKKRMMKLERRLGAPSTGSGVAKKLKSIVRG